MDIERDSEDIDVKLSKHNACWFKQQMIAVQIPKAARDLEDSKQQQAEVEMKPSRCKGAWVPQYSSS